MPVANAAADTITVVSDTETLKAIQSSVVKVEMTNNARYRIILLPNTNVFYGSSEGNVSTILDHNGQRLNFRELTLNYFRINNNVIEMSRQYGNVEYILRTSIVNATSLGGYMKVELEAINRSGSTLNLGGTFYWDLMVNGNDASAFEVIQNGWRNYSGGVQVTAFFANTYHVVDADRIWMGQYSSPDSAQLTGGYPPSYYTVGQTINASDTAAQFWWNSVPVNNGQSRKFSTIVGIGPQNTPPTFTLSSPTSGQTFYKGQQIQIAGTTRDTDVGDELTVKWSIDGGNENVLASLVANGSNQNFSFNYTIPTNMTDGAHTLQVWVMDDKGGVSGVNSVNFTVKSFDVPGTPVFNSVGTTSLQISWDKKQNDSTITYELHNQTTNETINTGSSNSATVNGLTPNTRYTFRVRAKNPTGQYTNYSASASKYTLANPPASASVTQNGNSPTATWSANGNPSGTTYKYELRNQSGTVVKSGTTTSTTANIPLDGISDGRYNLYICAINGESVSTAYVYAGEVMKDTTAPTAPTVTVVPNTWTNGSVNVTITHGTDALSGVQKSQYRIGTSGSWVDYNQSFTISSEGLQEVYARTIDNFGNISSVASSTARVDKTAPTTPSISTSHTGWTSSNVQVTVTSGNDGLSGVQKTQYKIGPGGTWTDYTGSFSISNEGITEVYARTIDNASNVSLEAKATVMIDTTPPSAPEIHLSETTWTNNDVKVTITSGTDNGSGVAKSQYKIGQNGAWVDYNKEFTISTEGQTEIFARTLDLVGNISSQTSATVLIDKTPPSDPQVLLSESTWTQNPVTFSISGSTDVNPIIYEFKINDGEYTTGTSGTISENGITTITVRARDSVGNVGRDVVKHIYIDHVDPLITITPNVQDWTDQDVQVSIQYVDEYSGVDPNKRFFKVTNSPDLPANWDSASSNQQEVVIQSEGIWYVHAKVEDLAGNSFRTTTSEIRLQRQPLVPENLRVTQVSERTAQVTFDLPNGVYTDGYQYEVRNVTTGQTWVLSHPSNTITDLELEGGRTYEYQVRAMNHVGISAFSSVVPALTLPKAPDNVVVQRVGTDFSKAMVSFDPVESAYAYRIVARDRNDNVVYDQTVTESVYQTIHGLSPGTMYTISVSGINASGEGAARNVGYLSLPTAPGNFNNVQIEENAITLNWNPVHSATRYILFRNGQLVYEGTELSFTDQGLQSGTIYDYELVAANETGPGEKTELKGVITLPGMVQNLQASAPTTNSIHLSWDEVRGAAQYVVLVDGKLYKQVPAGQPALTVHDLAPGSQYHFTVYAVNQSGQGAVTHTSGTTIPDQVSSVFVEEIGETDAKISWTPVHGATRYRLTVANKSFEVAGESYSISGLSGSTHYEFLVEAGNEAGYGLAKAGSFLTLPYSPNNVEVINTTEFSIALKWLPVETATSYIVTLNGKVVGNSPTAQFTAEGLSAGSIYRFGVQAVNPTGESVPSIFEWMTKPLAPSGIRTIPGVYSTTIMWDPVVGADEYLVEIGDNVLYRGKQTQFTSTGLSDGQDYDFTVRAINNYGVSSAKTAFGFKTLPRKPERVIATNVERSSLTLDLTDTQVQGADRYVIERNEDVIATIPAAQKFYNDEGLEAGTAYTYSIRAQNRSGSGEAFTFEVTTKTDPVEVESVRIEPQTYQLKASWDRVKGAASYQIRNLATNDTYTTSETEITIPKLNPGTNYTFEITAITMQGVVSKASTFTGLTKPARPASAGIARLSDMSVMLDLSSSWVQGADQLVIERDGKEIGRVDAGTYFFEEKGLEPGQDYTYVIKASNKSGASEDGYILTAKTVPASVDILAEATTVTENSATVSWVKVKGADGYRVFFGAEHVTTTADTMATIENLVSAQAYDNIFIVPFNSAGDATPIRVKEFVTLPVIQGLNIGSQPGSKEAKLFWSFPYKNEIFVIVHNGKEVYRGTDHEFTLQDLTPGDLVEVSFYTENSRGDRSEAVIHSFLMLPAAPADVKYAVSANSVSIDLSESRVNGASAYILMRNGTEIARIPAAFALYEDEGLAPGQTYEYEIRSVNDTGISEEAYVLVVKTLPSGMTGAPVVSNISTHGVEISWEPVEGASGYKLYLGDSLVQETDRTYVVLSGLESARLYNQFRIVPFNESGVGDGVDVPAFVTLPDSNFEVVAKGISTTQIEFSWTLPSMNETLVLSYNGQEIYRGKDLQFTWSGLERGTVYLVDAWTENEWGVRSEVKQVTARTLGVLRTPGGSEGGGSAPEPTEPSKPNESNQQEKELPPDLDNSPSLPTAPRKTVRFEDIDKTFNKDQIIFLAEQGIINGVTETRFEPNRPITRAEFTKLIVQLMGYESVPYQNTFIDVKSSDWYAPYIAIGFVQGLVEGKGGGVFAPNEKITREQAAVILANLLMKINAEPLNSGVRFADHDKISEWAVERVNYLSRMNMVEGYPDGTFRPQNHLTRAEAVALIYRLLYLLNDLIDE